MHPSKNFAMEMVYCQHVGVKQWLGPGKVVFQNGKDVLPFKKLRRNQHKKSRI